MYKKNTVLGPIKLFAKYDIIVDSERVIKNRCQNEITDLVGRNVKKSDFLSLKMQNLLT